MSLVLSGRGQSLKARVFVAPAISLAPMLKPSPVIIVGKVVRTSNVLNIVDLWKRRLDGSEGHPLGATSCDNHRCPYFRRSALA